MVEKAGRLARTEALPRLAVLLAARMAEVGPIAPGGVVGGAGAIGGVFSGVIVCSGAKADASSVCSIEGKRFAAGASASGEPGETDLGEGGDTRV